MFLSSNPLEEGTRNEDCVVAVVPCVGSVVGAVVFAGLVPPQAQTPSVVVTASMSDITFFIIKFSLVYIL
jgi:hypothetical protein